jgi:hypothetical protein
MHLIRALDVNLPQPIALTYPLFDSTGSIFDGGYYTVDSFSTWQFTRTLDCPWPPCINPLGRPMRNWEPSTKAGSVSNEVRFLKRRLESKKKHLGTAAFGCRAKAKAERKNSANRRR